MSETPLNQDQNSDEIDLKDLILPLWKARKQILTIAAICGIFGGIVGFLTPATYMASSTFLPQTGGETPGVVGGLASLAGINLNAPMSGGDIPPSMYATVLGSEPFRKEILDSKIWFNGDSVTYRSYLENQPQSGISILQEYTIGLPNKLIGLISFSNEKEQEPAKQEGIQQPNSVDYSFLDEISGKVDIVNDPNLGIVTISVKESDPFVAAQVTIVTEKVLQEWISEHKMKKAKAQYEFIEKQFLAKQKEFFSVQDQLAAYMDRNQNVLSASYLTRLDRLQTQFDLLNSVYTDLAKQKEQAAIQLNKATPTFSVLDPVKIPRGKIGPQKSRYLAIYFFLGLILSSFFYLAKRPIIKFVNDLKFKI
jgi:uncharacterized protein involved in exopolysaccharide biosynthesis